MATTIEVPCFRYVGKELSAPLTIEQSAGSGSVVFCRLRKSLYVLTPEERVRQALVWFLVEGAASALIWGKQLRFLVERSSLDLSAFHGRERAEPRFSPNMPVVIFETKRIERESEADAGAEEQIQGYMIRERCRSGFIFNGRQAAWLSLTGEFTAPAWTKTAISDLYDAEVRINRAADEVAAYVADCESTFTLAADGDFDALLKLVVAFGSNTGLTFFLSVRIDGHIGPMRAFNLKATNSDLISYRTRSTDSKHRLSMTRLNFHALRSIEPLCG